MNIESFYTGIGEVVKVAFRDYSDSYNPAQVGADRDLSRQKGFLGNAARWALRPGVESRSYGMVTMDDNGGYKITPKGWGTGALALGGIATLAGISRIGNNTSNMANQKPQSALPPAFQQGRMKPPIRGSSDNYSFDKVSPEPMSNPINPTPQVKLTG